MSLVNKIKININGYFSEMGTSEDIPEDILDIIEENDGNIGLVREHWNEEWAYSIEDLPGYESEYAVITNEMDLSISTYLDDKLNDEYTSVNFDKMLNEEQEDGSITWDCIFVCSSEEGSSANIELTFTNPISFDLECLKIISKAIDTNLPEGINWPKNIVTAIQYHNGDDYAYVDGYGLFKELNTDVKEQTIGIWKDDKLLGSW